MLRFRPRVEEPIFLLTRVTRIFQKIVFTETTRDARAGYRAGLFVARGRGRLRRAGCSCLQKKQGNTGDHTVSERPKWQSGRPRGSRNRVGGKGPAASRRPAFGCCMSALLGDRA